MAERLRRMSDAELGAALTAIGSELAFPEPGLDLAAVVAGRVAGDAAPSRDRFGSARRWIVRILPPRGVRRVLVIALLVVALTAITAGAAYVGVRGIQIVFGSGGSPTPTAAAPSSAASGVSPGASPSPLPSPTLPGLGDRFELGNPSSLDAARAAADFDVAVPPAVPGFDRPRVFLGDNGFVSRVSFVWVKGGTPKLLLTEFRADPYRPYIRKYVEVGGLVTKVDVNGERGYWLSGAAHELDYVDRDGQHFTDASRLAGNTLVWTRGDVTLRLEGAPALRGALRIARATR